MIFKRTLPWMCNGKRSSILNAEHSDFMMAMFERWRMNYWMMNVNEWLVVFSILEIYDHIKRQTIHRIDFNSMHYFDSSQPHDFQSHSLIETCSKIVLSPKKSPFESLLWYDAEGTTSAGVIMQEKLGALKKTKLPHSRKICQCFISVFHCLYTGIRHYTATRFFGDLMADANSSWILRHPRGSKDEACTVAPTWKTHSESPVLAKQPILTYHQRISTAI
jgi:hypothetical protein